MATFWKKGKHPSSLNDVQNLFSEWVEGTDCFSCDLDPLERTRRLLREIQKRSLAEQVLIVSWSTERKRNRITGIWPSEERILLHSELLDTLLRKSFEEDRSILWEDAWEDEDTRKDLERSRCESFLIHPVIVSDTSMDALVIMNYSRWAASPTFREFITFIGSVVALSIQNYRLYHILKKKDDELKDWAELLEDRIQEGTKKILEKELQFYTLFKHAKDGIIVHEGGGRILEVNHAVSHMLGYSKKELTGSNWNRICLPDHLSEQIGFFRKVLRREPVKTLDTALRKQDGTVFRVELTCTQVRFQGQVVIQSTIRDMSLRHMLEASYRETKEKYRIFLESSMVGIYIVKDGSIQFVNSMLERITGLSKSELMSKTIDDLILSEDQKRIQQQMASVLAGTEATDPYEVRFIHKDGSSTWCEVRNSRVILDGKAAILGNVIDISERKELQYKLLETQKLESIRTLAGGIAHDFNNLLGGILGYASLLLSDMERSDPHYEDIQAIADTTKRAAELTNRLLAFARGGKYHVSPLNLNRLIDKVTERIDQLAERPVTIQKETQQSIWPVLGDATQIEQSILNICLNAYDAMPIGGRLFLASENMSVDTSSNHFPASVPEGDYVCIQVSDTGIGMDERVKTRMFDPFFTTKPLGEGSGMGLAMVYGIVKNHGGFIDVESEPGKRKRLRIFLPRYLPKEVEKSAKPIRTAIAGKSKEILFVDDEQIIRQVAKRMLEKGGYIVHLARHGKEALELYKKRSQHIDLVLLDFVMPVMGGRETYRQLKALDADVKVAFTSGYSLYDKPEYIPLGKAFFIQKPFQTESLLQKISEIL